MTESSKNQKNLTEALLRVEQLKHENYILFEQLKSKDNILKLFLKEMDVIFWAISHDKTIEYIVGNGLEAFDIKAVDVLGRSIYDAVRFLPDLLGFLERSLEGKAHQENINNGDSIEYKFTSLPIFDDEEELLHVFVIAIPL